MNNKEIITEVFENEQRKANNKPMINFPLSKQDGALKKHSVNVFSEWASLPRWQLKQKL